MQTVKAVSKKNSFQYLVVFSFILKNKRGEVGTYSVTLKIYNRTTEKITAHSPQYLSLYI